MAYKHLTISSILILAFDCNLTAFLYNSDSAIIQIGFAVTLFCAAFIPVINVNHLSADGFIRFLKNDFGLKYGSLLVIAGLLLTSFISSTLKVSLSFILLLFGTALLSGVGFAYGRNNKHSH